MLGIGQKTPEDRLDFDIDFESWLPDADTIESAVAVVTSGTVVFDQLNILDAVVKVWLSGGTDGETAEISVTITTAGQRIKEVCFKIRVKGC